MQDKITKIIMLLMLVLPIRTFSMADSLFEVGVDSGIFVVLTILSVVAFVLSKIVEKREKKS